MRIFHGTTEIAGQMGILSSALNKKGHCSVGYNTFHSYLGYKDYLINTDQEGLNEKYNEIINEFDLFHFHYNTTLCEEYSDLPELKKRHKKMVMHHWGNDVRFHEQARNNNPYVYTGDSPPNEEIHAKLIKITEYIKEAIVQDYEVYEYVKDYYEKVHVLPIAIDLTHFEPHYPAINKDKPLILHAPTNPDFKGTTYVEKTIEKLREKYDIDYRRIEKMSHEEVISLYADADIIIDQVLCGSYGLLSVESMALGKPVLTYIRPDLVPTFPAKLPIINSNPDTLYKQVEMLLEIPELRREHGMQGRKYVEKYHSHEVVVERLMAIYSKL
ncbi:glycosyltransferase family 1 protein [Bacillus timonensis]|uniref:Glycosyltransferase family 1 protein n=1 Tax=Bacillus timonensis TaxID=1033734 RepID=A0A4S3PS00_9BACI|nr:MULTISPECIES: glycosyltransferase family 4 protein [Bacillus]MCC3355667.1 glycosyltransferase family 4 protein [Bacillus sp. REN16]THE12046.1 glycosyltransferase family 1 protein [Bacillus timonensis]